MPLKRETMRVYTRTTKVLGVTPEELCGLEDLVRKAKVEGKAEVQVGHESFLAIDVSDMYRQISRGEREHERRMDRMDRK